MLDDLNPNYSEGGSDKRKQFCTSPHNWHSEQDLTLCITGRSFGETWCLHLQNDGIPTWHTGMHSGVTASPWKWKQYVPPQGAQTQKTAI